MVWRWIVYGALGIWLSGALFDLLIGTLRVLYGTREYGYYLRSTLSYFLNAICLIPAYGTLAWLFYTEYVGEFWTIMIGAFMSFPEAIYVAWRIYTAPTSIERDRPSIVD